MRAYKLLGSILQCSLLGWLALMLLALLALPVSAQDSNEPQNVRLTANTTSSITIEWGAVSGATGYAYRQSLPRTGPAVAIGAGATSVTVSNLSDTTFYGFQVSSVVNGEQSSWSANAIGYTNPLAPKNLRATCVAGTVVSLAWDAPDRNSANVRPTPFSYEVKIDSGSWQARATSRARVIESLNLGTTYTFAARAVLPGGAQTLEGAGAETTLTLTTAAAQVEPPTNLQTPSGDITSTSIKLTWTASTTSSVTYEVSKDGGSTWVAASGTLEHSFTGLDPETSYSFRARAKSGSSTSCANAAQPVTTHPNAPASPTSLTTSGITQTAITLSWTKSAGATAYKVQVDSGTVTTLGDVATHTFTGLSANTQYTLKVIASNSGGDSAAVSRSASTLPNAPAAPTGLTTSGISQTAITLSWTKSTGATGYKVRKDSGDSWTVLGDVSTVIFSGLSADTSYTLEVLASNSGGDSAAATVNASTHPNAPAAPTSLTTGTITQTSIVLNWAKSAGATGYKVQVDSGTVTTLGDVATHTFSGLSAGTSYTLKVIAFNAGGDSAATAGSASTLPNAPAAPTGLTTSGITQSAITLSWTKSTGATAYKVQVDSGTVTTLGDVATHTFSGLSASTQYTLKVIASNSGGDSAAASTSASTSAALPNAPAAPTGLTTSGITQTAITLSWTKSTGATAYKVQVDSGTLTTLGDVATYTFSGLSAGTQYTLKVIASNSGGDSAAATVNASTSAALPNTPSAPTGLTISGITQSAITLSWTKSTGATAYKVQVDSGTVTTLGDVATYTFSGLSANTQYTLKVIASNSGGDSAAASTSASTLPNAPAAPTGLTTSAITQSAITLSWTKSTGATGYKVQVDSGTVTTLGDVATYTFSGLSAGTSYTLKVFASNSGGDSAAASTSASTLAASPNPPPNPPSAPTGLAVSSKTDTSITVTWTKSTGATAYKVQVGSGTVSTLGDVATHTFSGLTANTLYTLNVSASNNNGDSTAASVDERTWALPAPTGLAVSAKTDTSITVEWTKSAGATAYKVQVGSGTVSTLGDVATHTFSGLTANTQYTLRVSASNSVGDSAAATIDETTFALPAPTNLSISNIGASQMQLNWTKSAGATTYEVKLSSASTWTDAGDVALYLFTGLDLNTAYTLEVRAKSSAGVSAIASDSDTTLSTAPALTAPTGLSVTGILPQRVTLGWTKVSGATAYKVRIYPTGGQAPQFDALGDVDSHVFGGLSASTGYTLEVKASNSGGDSTAASTSVTTLASHPTTLPAVSDFDSSDITQTSITVTWTKVDGATQYILQAGSQTFVRVRYVDSHTFTGLTPGTDYTLSVFASNPSATSNRASIDRSTLPGSHAAPTGLTTSGITQTAITLSWTKSTGATAYKVQVDNGAITTLGDVATHTFTGLSAGTSYTLKVIASSSDGDSSAASTSASTLTAAPSAPTGLTTSGISQTSITLAWTKSAGATAYKVRAGTTGDFTLLGDVATYTFTSLTANTAYTLQVVASNAGGDSSIAQTSASTNNVPPPPAPSAPTGLTTSGITQTAITLTWTKSAGATGYKVQADSGTVTALGDVATYTFSSLSAGTSYTLKVSATNAGGDSAAASVSASTLPAAPTGLSTSGITQTAITLSWTKSTGATAYKVQVDSGTVATLGDVATHTFSGLSAGTQYTLKVIASGSGGDSTAATVTASTLPNAPSAPTGLTTSGITQTAITLSWTKSAGATGYKVQVDSGTVVTLGDVATHTFSSLSAGTSYTLKVSATNAGGDSAAASVSASALPAVPTGLSTSGITQTAITVTWTKSAGATGYDVKLSTANSWTTLGDVATYAFGSLSANTQYTLQVRAKNSAGATVAASVSARTLATQPAALASPTSVTTSGITQTSITLNWSKSSGATSYEVYASTLTGWADVGDVATYTFTGLTADSPYTVSVRAKNGLSTSAGVSATARTLPNPPDPPSDLEASLTDPNSVEVEWDRSAGADSYEIHGSATSDQPGSQAVPVGLLGDWMNVGNVDSYVISGLSPNTRYLFEVRAVNLGGRSGSAAVNFQTESERQAGQPISDFVQDSGGDTVRDGGVEAVEAGSSGGARPAVSNEFIATPTVSRTAFNCTEAQKARISISDQPIALNVQCVGPEGIGNRDLIARGGIFGIDVWGWVRGYPEFCFRQTGDLAFLDAAFTPRRLMQINAYSRDGMTCAQVDRAGTLVLLPSDTILLPTAEPAALPAQTLSGECSATTLDFLNLRASPAGAILRVLPAYATLDVYKRQGAWIQVEYYGQRGWISAEYANLLGDCG